MADKLTRAERAKLNKILAYYKGGKFPVFTMPAAIAKKTFALGAGNPDCWKLIRAYFDAAGLITGLHYIGFRAWVDKDGNYHHQNHVAGWAQEV